MSLLLGMMLGQAMSEGETTTVTKIVKERAMMGLPIFIEVTEVNTDYNNVVKSRNRRMVDIRNITDIEEKVTHNEVKVAKKEYRTETTEYAIIRRGSLSSIVTEQTYEELYIR